MYEIRRIQRIINIIGSVISYLRYRWDKGIVSIDVKAKTSDESNGPEDLRVHVTSAFIFLLKLRIDALFSHRTVLMFH